MKTIRKSRVLSLALLLLVLAAAPPLAAQEPPAAPAENPAEAAEEPVRDDSEYTEEIVVTARRREENLQQIPVSATAFTQSNLEERSATRLYDLAGTTPNLDITSGTFAGDTSDAGGFPARRRPGRHRGVHRSRVGIYLDGIYLARAQGSLLDLVDLERVEILRGPQGTLFGKNTTGGAIQLITRRPRPRAWPAGFALTAGNHSTIDGQLSVDGPLAAEGSLAGSLAVYSANSDGWSRSLASGQKFHDDGRDLVRAGLECAPPEGGPLGLFHRRLPAAKKAPAATRRWSRWSTRPSSRSTTRCWATRASRPTSSAYVVDDPRTSWGAGSSIGKSFLEGEVFGLSLDLTHQGPDRPAGGR